jgi:choice-of-anchor B domain-containing protein
LRTGFIRSRIEHFEKKQATEQASPDFSDRRIQDGACVDGKASDASDTYDCNNVDLEAYVDLSQLGVRSSLDDIWGWTDTASGREFAIVDGYDRIIFVEITVPSMPVVLGYLQSKRSWWHDVKTYANHVFVVSEAKAHQMRVFNLTRLLNVENPSKGAAFSLDATFGSFGAAHNIVINEDTGFAYIVGSGACSGGLYMVDITNPQIPAGAGCYSEDGYTHDAQCVTYNGPDATYTGHEICFAANENSITIVDVTIKTNPTQISKTTWSGRAYIHQGWLTEDHQYFFINEETTSRAVPTRILDVSSLSIPTGPSSYNAVVIATNHNNYIRGGLVFQAKYRIGLRILRIHDASSANLTEVGFFDTSIDYQGLGYDGAWSNYPFFPSCTIVVSDIDRGLYILKPTGDALCDVSTSPSPSYSQIPTTSSSTRPSLSPSKSPSPSSSPSTSSKPTYFSGAPSSGPTASCIAPSAGTGCSPTTNCCSGQCTSGQPTGRVCAAYTSIPAPVSTSPPADCAGNAEFCNSNPNGCCSNVCKNNGRCQGNRRQLRHSFLDDDDDDAADE